MFSRTASKEDFNSAVQQLNKVSNITALTYLPTGYARAAFFYEIKNFISHITREVDIQCMSLSGAIKTLNEETDNLRNQEFQLMAGRMVQYAAVKKEVHNRRIVLVLKQVGFVSGGVQFFGGTGICAASMGGLCAAYGASLAAHGFNNVYENGYYLLYRKNIQGCIRQAYRELAKGLGYSKAQADVVYSVVDIGLSGYGLVRNIPKSDSFRLFRHINTDFIRGWKDLGPVPLVAEIIGDINTLQSVYPSSGEN